MTLQPIIKNLYLDFAKLDRPRRKVHSITVRQGEKNPIELHITVSQEGNDTPLNECVNLLKMQLPSHQYCEIRCLPGQDSQLICTLPPVVMSTPGTINTCYLESSYNGEIKATTECIEIKVLEAADITPGQVTDYVTRADELSTKLKEICDTSKRQFTEQKESQESQFNREQNKRNTTFEQSLNTYTSMVTAAVDAASQEKTELSARLTRQQEQNNSSQQANTLEQLKNNQQQAANNAAAQGLFVQKLTSSQYDSKRHPTITGKPGTLYLVPSSTHDKDNVYDEWMTIEDKWEKIGSTATTIKPISTSQIDTILGGDSLSSDEALTCSGLSYYSVQLLNSIEETALDLESFKGEVSRQLTKSQSKPSASEIVGLKRYLLDAIYPVGAVYISFNSTNPSTLFGGTWSQITGRFLFASDSSGTTGGEREHTLTVDELPSHSHEARIFMGYSTADRDDTKYFKNGTGNALTRRAKTQSTGGGQPHNNMPPYITCYVWRRTY